MAVVALDSPRWTEHSIASLLSRETFARDLVCPNCTVLGFEADLLVVHRTLRVIDVEIKISRSDFKADREKGKWWREVGVPFAHEGWPRQWIPPEDRVRLAQQWPPKVWKHYYALPAELWKPELAEYLPAMSGLLLIGRHRVEHKQRAKPNPFADPLSPAAVINIARLVSVRYWQHAKGVRP